MTDTAPSLIAELEQALAAGDAEQRTRMLEEFSKLFATGSGRHTEAQLSLFDDVLVRLTAAIELEARVRLARHLAPLANAPRKAIRSLAFDDAIEVAGPVLTQSPQLSEEDLVDSASTKGPAHLFAIAQRSTLSEAVTDVLVDRGDRRTVRSVAQNEGARFSEHGFTRLVDRAADDDTLAEHVGVRPDLPRHHLVKLLQTASAAVRARLEAANPQARALIQHMIADIAGGIGADIRNASKDHGRAKHAAKRRYLTQQLGEADIHAGAAQQNFEKTAVALALLGPYPIDLVERALLDETPDMVLVLLRAAGCSRITVKTVLSMQASGRSLSPQALEEMLGQYDRLRKATAKRILTFHRRRQAEMTKGARRAVRPAGEAVANSGSLCHNAALPSPG